MATALFLLLALLDGLLYQSAGVLTPTQNSQNNHAKQKGQRGSSSHHLQLAAVDGHGTFFNRLAAAASAASAVAASPSTSFSSSQQIVASKGLLEVRAQLSRSAAADEGNASSPKLAMNLQREEARRDAASAAASEQRLDGWQSVCDALNAKLHGNGAWISKKHPLAMKLSCKSGDFSVLQLLPSKAGRESLDAGEDDVVAEFRANAFRTWTRRGRSFFALDLRHEPPKGRSKARQSWPFDESAGGFYLRGGYSMAHALRNEVGLVAGSNTQAVSFAPQ